MKYSKIRKMDVANGPGIRVSIFMQGCEFHCKNCFNPETWSFDEGKEFTSKTIERIINLSESDYIKGLSVLGGEPMHPKNIQGTTELIKKFKEKYPHKNVWAWSGFPFEYIKTKDVIKYIDVLVDGQYVDELHDFRLKFRGSSNQRVIDVQKSLKEKKVIIYE